MALVFNQIVLYTKNKELLAAQLCSLFEFEILHAGNGLRLKHNGPTFALIDDAEQNPGHNESTLFDYTVATSAELKELLQTLEFFFYRNKDIFKDQQPPSIYKNLGHEYFILNDIDGRKWKFSYFE